MSDRPIPFFPKNPKPLQLAQYSAIVITVVLLVYLMVVKLFLVPELGYSLIFLLVMTIYFVSFMLIVVVMEKYIYKRVKLIYKTIHRLKAPGKGPSVRMDMQTHLLDQVEKEVISWAATHKKEIDDLKRLEAYRRDFIGNVSHELKTPIFNMQGYLDTLLEGGLYDRSINVTYLKRASLNLERLQNITEDLDMINRLENNIIAVEYQKFDLHQLTIEVFADLEMMAAEKQITFKLKEDSLFPCTVNADRERIRQVLDNLVSNSIKYGSENGETVIGFYDMDDKTILIEVSDDGMGIEEKHLSRLFERFYRVDKSRSRNQGGTGLGLSIVKHLIEAHHQIINVRSTLGFGSTFGFTLEKG